MKIAVPMHDVKCESFSLGIGCCGRYFMLSKIDIKMMKMELDSCGTLGLVHRIHRQPCHHQAIFIMGCQCIQQCHEDMILLWMGIFHHRQDQMVMTTAIAIVIVAHG